MSIQYKIKKFELFFISIILVTIANAQQINISRIEQMPNLPSPYLMRDWEQVAIGYDSLVFNFGLSGDFLPLGHIKTTTVNYPEHNSFVLHTVVGTPYTESGESINCLPAVISASLVGIDKRNQNGYDWVLMSEEWFNNRPEQAVYKNHPVDDTYDDWWYSTMPNVFFYQLYDLYPNTGDFTYQLKSVGDQWLLATESMGGKLTPWKVPYMNYRGFDLRSMTPYDSDPTEPESAGAIAWILYNAYAETKNEDYRIGAEWAIEFLNGWGTNPSYELQLSYGACIAARMNAELGTDYDITKFVNWCFNIGPLRNWGAILGTWDGIDVHGLIGESIVNDYAFSMNTFEQVGALVPLVRYDDRFSRAIAKWVLNAANASRLFYPNYLPGFKQDSEEWAYQYDPNSYIAHEAMRETGPGGWSPYATGDAISGGWGATNLTLYSSSHVGILGGIIDTTNVEGILKLDLLKTDYFHSEAYPTYLYYNPHNEAKSVSIKLPSGNYDLYDVVSNTFIATGVTGNPNINIDGDSVMQLVFVPSGGSVSYFHNKTLVNSIIIDYNSGLAVSNYPPRIKSLSPISNPVVRDNLTQIYCTAEDLDGHKINYNWISSGGTITGSDSVITWQAPSQPGLFTVSVIVDDQNGAYDTTNIEMEVVGSINHDPQINKIKASPRKIDLGGEAQIECFAVDEDKDELSYMWNSASGTITGSGSIIRWTAPTEVGNYYIYCEVTDNKGGIVLDSISLSIRDFSDYTKGNLVAFYPFNGNTNDESGNALHGTNFGAQLTSDRFNNLNSAYSFDGENDYISISNNNLLNFTKMISINFWIKINELFDREAYPLSHGSWNNRWKASISNKSMRWTLKTSSGIKDLDSETKLEEGSLYNVTLIYSGTDFEVYLNGDLDAFSSWSGDISTTNINLTIGQMLPSDNNYNFKGVLDDVRIYDYALSTSEIEDLYDIETSIKNDIHSLIPQSTKLYQNYPNPFNGSTQFMYDINEISNVTLDVYDLLGRKISTLFEGYKNPGKYSVVWNSTDANGHQLASGVYFIRFRANQFINTKKIVLLQ